MGVPAQGLSALALAALLAACAPVTRAPLAAIEGIEARVVPASAWGSVPAEPGSMRPHAVTRITLHHGGVAYARGRDPAEYLRALQAWSRRDRTWPDVPYHYVIDPDGGIWEGRDIRYAGDTNTDYDPAGHALVVVLGNFEEEVPAERQLAAAADVMALLAARHGVPPDRIGGHRDHAAGTACPGRHLARYLENGWFRERVAQRLQASGGTP